MEIIKKIAKAKSEIKESKIKKEGRNDFSKYDYFTPAQIEALVSKVCKENNLLTKFDLIRDNLGVFGRLTIFDCDSSEQVTYDMASAIPEIKATNIAQQLGGCVTYTERYLKMSAFGITDCNLDFDSQNQEKKESKSETVWLTKEQFEKALLADGKGIQATLNAFNGKNGKQMSKEMREKLNAKLTALLT